MPELGRDDYRLFVSSKFLLLRFISLQKNAKMLEFYIMQPVQGIEKKKYILEKCYNQHLISFALHIA